MQNYVSNMKSSKTAGLYMQSISDMIAYSQALSIPPTLSLLTAAPSSALVTSVVTESLYIPMDCLAYGIHGACYTGKVQVTKWMAQLAQRPLQWQLHIDGKYKLHHQKFLLLTLGTHRLRYDHGHSTLANSFVPLVYLFCKEGERDGAVQLLIDSFVSTGQKYYETKLTPGAASTDHAPALRKGIENTWPGVEFGQCWPHLIRKFVEGEWAKHGVTKTWMHFEMAEKMIRHIHMAQSTGMKYLIIKEVGKIWDTWGHEMDAFWDSNLTDPWDCFSICDMQTPLSTPSNQVQEAWHNQILKSRIPGMFKQSTTNVITQALPKLIRLDGTFIPDVLSFDVSEPNTAFLLPTACTVLAPSVQVPAVPREILLKGKWYVDNTRTHVHIAKEKGDFFWYVLRKSNEAGLKKVTNKSLEAYIDTFNGKKPTGIKSYEALTNACFSYQLVRYAPSDMMVPDCDFNKAKLLCTCKGYKQYAICSHVAAVNHLLHKVDLEDSVKELHAPRKAGGYRKGVRPALMKEREADSFSDSSEDEPLSKRRLLAGPAKKKKKP